MGVVNPRLFSMANYLGVYRDDDGIMVMRSNWDKKAVKSWRDDFQRTINEALGSDRLHFTAVAWGADKEDGSELEDDVTVHVEENFPFLDMDMLWNDQELQFKVHLKENQQLKYLNSGSEHPQACYKAIPKTV